MCLTILGSARLRPERPKRAPETSEQLDEIWVALLDNPDRCELTELTLTSNQYLLSELSEARARYQRANSLASILFWALPIPSGWRMASISDSCSGVRSLRSRIISWNPV